METLRGTVTNCQHTLNVSGGGKNTSTTTTYITLFRVNDRAVEFRSTRPMSVSDGDQVAVAGSLSGATMTVLAMRNVTTGEVANTGVISYFFGAVLVFAIGVAACVFVVGQFGSFDVALVMLVVCFMASLFVRRALNTIQAEKLVSA